MSPQRRLRIFEQHKGICVLCQSKIDGVRQKWIVEHVRALGLGGEDDDKNCAPAHEHCRREKDKDDVARISKAKRVKARHLGIRKPATLQGRGFPKKPARAVPQLPMPPRRWLTPIGGLDAVGFAEDGE